MTKDELRIRIDEAERARVTPPIPKHPADYQTWVEWAIQVDEQQRTRIGELKMAWEVA